MLYKMGIKLKNDISLDVKPSQFSTVFLHGLFFASGASIHTMVFQIIIVFTLGYWVYPPNALIAKQLPYRCERFNPLTIRTAIWWLQLCCKSEFKG